MSPKNKMSAYYNCAPRETELLDLSNIRTPDAAQLQNVTLNHFETVTFRSTHQQQDAVGGSAWAT